MLRRQLYCSHTAAESDPEYRVVRSDATQVGIGGIGTHTLEKDSYLRFPPLEIGAENFNFLVIGQLLRFKCLRASTHPQFACTRCSEIAHPLCLAAGCNQILLAIEIEKVDGRRLPLPALPASNPKFARPPNAQTGPG